MRRLLRRTTGAWLPWAVCAEYVAAEVMSGLPPAAERATGEDAIDVARSADRDAAADDPSRAGPRDAAGVSRPIEDRMHRRDALVRLLPALAPGSPSLFVEALREGLTQADAFELDRRLRRAVALERGGLCRMAPLLAAVAGARAYRSLGLGSLDAYARERLGMSPRKARALLRLERACCRSPALRGAWEGGRVSWSQAQTLVAVVTAPDSERWHDAWIERAGAVSVRRLDDDVDDALERGELDPRRSPALPELGVPGVSDVPGMSVGPDGVQTRARPTHWRERTQVVVCASPEVVRLFRVCLATVQLMLERSRGQPATPGEALEAVCEHVLSVWTAAERRLTPGERRARRVYERDGWRCTVPGCSSYRNLQAHHIRFRSRGGGDEAANLTTLCAAHHHRAVHTRRIRIQGSAPHALRFEMPLGSWRSGDHRAVTR